MDNEYKGSETRQGRMEVEEKRLYSGHWDAGGAGYKEQKAGIFDYEGSGLKEGSWHNKKRYHDQYMEVCGLWAGVTSDKKTYMMGSLGNGISVKVGENKYKRAGKNDPDYYLYFFKRRCYDKKYDKSKFNSYPEAQKAEGDSY